MRFVPAAAALLLVALTPDATAAASRQARDNLAACQEADRRIRQATPLSSCRAASGDVTIGSGDCATAFVDQDYTGAKALGKVTIGAGGTLYVPDATLEIELKSIAVVGVPGAGGGAKAVLQVGTASCPVGSLDANHHVTLRFAGNRPDAKHVHQHEHKSGDDCTTIDKGLGVGVNGELRMYGARGVPADGVSWTHLAMPAGSADYQVDQAETKEPYQNFKRIGAPVALGGELVLHLARDVTTGRNPWQPGDWIVVGTTSFSPFESEFVQIDQVVAANGGSKVTLKAATPLRHYHFGGRDPGPAYDPGSPRGTASRSFSGGIATNFGVDERAEVGLVSRSVTLTAQTPTVVTPGDPALHWGGEMRFCKGYADVGVEGVEIEKFGKDQLGSYPLHFHKADESAWTPGTRPTPPSGTHWIHANSIHHSYNKCGTIHSSSKISFDDNVCARITGHAFYQEIGDEFDSAFNGNLALGVMLNGFGLTSALQPTPDSIVTGWWEGDYLGRMIGFDGLKIANTDAGTNPTVGQCYAPGNGGLVGGTPPSGIACPAGQVLYEAPSGFWIVNPTAALDGNSVGGCQSNGKGYWYVAPRNTPGDARFALKFQPVGVFTNNRVHGCYDGVFGETDAGTVVEQLQPKVNGDNNELNLIARFDGFTASRIRNRGVWMRPLWFVFENARVASSREDVSLVTSGGLDGNGPGAWGLLKHSTVVGWSLNNVDRWGPCPDRSRQEGPGCVDRNPQANDLFEKGYPSPAWNFAGFYIYDGPVRIHDTRFVNFRHDPGPLLTLADAAFMDAYSAYYTGKVYEGDAALGWFQNNQSAYPTSTEVRGLKFENTNLRHQVFTDQVNFGNFDDGDKNTAVVDRDGSLTGFRVVDAAGAPAAHRHVVSLNNLPFNATSNAVDECLSTGAQDKDAEARPTSLISPADIATLEFGALALPDGRMAYGADNAGVRNLEPKITQLLTFTHDAPDLFGLHRSMTLHSRNNQGVWEPKIAGGHGYTVSAASAAREKPAIGSVAGPAGIPRYINVGLTDVLKPDARTKPFYSRIGVCYTNKDGSHPLAKFAIERGYRSWGGNGTNFNDLRLRRYFNKYVNLYDRQTCHNLDHQQNDLRTPGEDNTDAMRGCPADGVVPLESAAQCAADGGKAGKSNDVTPVDDVCIFETRHVKAAASLDELTDADGTPKDLDKHFYDATTGMLFFYVVQEAQNAQAASPLGSCRGQAGDDPACPNPVHPQFPESYYGCPPQGCSTYTVRMDAAVAYDPGPSACGDPADASRTTDPTAIYRYLPGGDARGRYAQPRPADAYALAYVPSPASSFADVREGKRVVPKTDPGAKGFAHVAAEFPPYCGGELATGARAQRGNAHDF
ncbi:MAG: G8 domain-containing protein [Casimicrobiaceae bacterium]